MSYETDLTLWAEEQAGLLRQGRLAELDRENLAEEIESLGRRDRREAEGRLRILLAHLLKWSYQPDLRSRSWRSTISTQLQEILDLLEESPSLRPRIEARWPEIYKRARGLAEEETGLVVLPLISPWTLDDVLSNTVKDKDGLS